MATEVADSSKMHPIWLPSSFAKKSTMSLPSVRNCLSWVLASAHISCVPPDMKKGGAHAPSERKLCGSPNLTVPQKSPQTKRFVASAVSVPKGFTPLQGAAFSMMVSNS